MKKSKERVTPTQIKNILASKYHGIQLIEKKLDNIIQSTRKIVKDDALKIKNKDPLWFVEASVDIYTNRLNKLFWINPTQKKKLEQI